MTINTLIFFKRLYLFIHERHIERKRHRQREKQAPSGEPDMGLDPRTTGSRPEPKADEPPRHPALDLKGCNHQTQHMVLKSLIEFRLFKNTKEGYKRYIWGQLRKFKHGLDNFY